MSRPKGSVNKLTKEVKETLQDITDKVINTIDIEELDTNQKLKFLQISLQYALPRLKNISENSSKEPSEVNLNIVTTSEELDRLNKVNAYEKEHNVKIL